MPLLVLTLALSSVINLGQVSLASPSDELRSSEVTVEKVVVKDEQKGHFLALIPLAFNLEVVSYADGRLELHYPWYVKFSVYNHEELETLLLARIDTALKENALGSVRVAGEPKIKVYTALEAELVSSAIEAVLAENKERE